MSAESLRNLVEFIGAIFIAFISHYLTKSHYERKRQDELADREYKRRTERMDKRLEEANAYVDKLAEVSRLVWTQGNRLIHTEKLNEYVTRHEKIRDIMDSMAIKAPNVFLLEDSQMQDLNREMVRLIGDTRQKITRLSLSIKRRESINKDEFNNSLSEFSKKCS